MIDGTGVCAVRLKTTHWSNSKGLYVRRDLTYLKRKCSGFNCLEEDVNAVDAQTTIGNITNLDECEDGVYEVIPCNHQRDRESGNVDSCEYKLVPLHDKV